MGVDNKDIDSISDCSFDETSMDSCPLAAITETRGNDLSKDGNEVEVTSLEEAKSVIAALRARQRAQAHQMLAWRRTLKLQVRTGIKYEWDKITGQSELRPAYEDFTRSHDFKSSQDFLKCVCNNCQDWILYFSPIFSYYYFNKYHTIHSYKWLYLQKRYFPTFQISNWLIHLSFEDKKYTYFYCKNKNIRAGR